MVTRRLGHGGATGTLLWRATHASATRRLGYRGNGRCGAGIGGERIGQALRMERQRAIPGPVEGRAHEPPPQPMRAGPRHAGGAGGLRDVTGGEQGGEEEALPVRRPAGAGGGCGRCGRGRMGCGVLVHL